MITVGTCLQMKTEIYEFGEIVILFLHIYKDGSILHPRTTIWSGFTLPETEVDDADDDLNTRRFLSSELNGSMSETLEYYKT